MSSGTCVPSCGRLTSSGAVPRCRVKVSMRIASASWHGRLGMRASRLSASAPLPRRESDGSPRCRRRSSQRDAALQRHREALQDLVGAFAQQVDADHARAPSPTQTSLNRLRCGESASACSIGAEIGAIAPAPSSPWRCARLCFGQADHAQRRMREHHGGDVVVIEPRIRLAAEHAIHQPARGGDGDRRQRDAVGDIADRMHAVDAGVLPFVDDDVTRARRWRRRPSSRPRSSLLGCAAGGEDQRVEWFAGLAVGVAPRARCSPSTRSTARDLHAEMQRDAVPGDSSPPVRRRVRRRSRRSRRAPRTNISTRLPSACSTPASSTAM